jgi:hypothetical protein
MEFVKKSFNTSGDLAQRIDDFIRANPGISFTWLVNQALVNWLQNPQVMLKNPKPMTADDVNRFMDENKDLMDDLAK